MNTPTIIPKIIGNRLLIRRIPAPEVSKGGLVVLGRELPAMGIVVAVGSGPRSGRFGLGPREPITDVEVGDEVTFDKWAPESRNVHSLGDDMFILDYDSCFLRIRKEDKNGETKR